MDSYHENFDFLQDYIQANTKKYLVKATKDLDLILFENVSLSNSVKDLSKIYSKELDNKKKDLKEHYKDLMFYIDNDYTNVLMTGVGSKIDFLTDFAEDCLSEYPILTINGFMNGITLKYVLNKICNFLTQAVTKDKKDIVDEEQTKVQKRSKIQQMEFIKGVLSGEDDSFKYPRVILIIHSLDGKALRSAETQQVLSEIASLEKVTLLASIDNYFYQTLLTPQMLENYNFKIVNIDTFALYQKEFLFVDDYNQGNKKKGVEGLKFILRSFTPNQKDIIKTLSKFLLENPTSSGLDLKQFFKLCYDETIVSSEAQLKQNMLEVLDHKVILENKGNRGKLLYTMDFSRAVLEQIINDEFE